MQWTCANLIPSLVIWTALRQFCQTLKILKEQDEILDNIAISPGAFHAFFLHWFPVLYPMETYTYISQLSRWHVFVLILMLMEVFVDLWIFQAQIETFLKINGSNKANSPTYEDHVLRQMQLLSNLCSMSVYLVRSISYQ